MTILVAPSTNEIQNTIATGNSFERGTDTTITLTDGSAFPNAAHVIRIRNLDDTKWCLVIYTSKVGNVLTMGGGAADYALAKCVTVGDEAYEWPAGSVVELVTAADEIAQLFSEDGTWTKKRDAGGYAIEDIGAATYFKYIGSDNVVRGWKPRAGQCTRANVDIYVRTDGNDANDGSANDSGHALLTIQKAVDLIPDLIAHTVEIHIEDGVYEETVSIRNKYLVVPAASLTLTGDTGTPANCNIAGDTGGNNTPARRHCIVIMNCTEITLNGIKCDYGGADTGSLGERANLYAESATIRLKNFEAKNSGARGVVVKECIVYLGDYSAATNPVSITNNTEIGYYALSSRTLGGAIDCGHNGYGINIQGGFANLQGDASNDVMVDNSGTGYGMQSNYGGDIRAVYVELGANATYGAIANQDAFISLTYGNKASGANTTQDLRAENHGMFRHANDDVGLGESIDSVDRDDVW